MEPAISSVAAKKLAALEKGELTDCSFLVGPDEADAQVMHAFKSDLVVASEYFAALLRSPLTTSGPQGAIRLEDVTPAVFKLVLEHIHTCGQKVTEVNDLEECLELAAAAHRYLLDDLGHFCTEMLRKLLNMDNVWTVFSLYHLIEYISTACEKFLRINCEECLKKPNFLKIDCKALSKFLCIDSLVVNSELVLLTACLRFFKGKEDERALFRRFALPHLRLLTLRAGDLAKVAPFLDLPERMFLSLSLRNFEDPLLNEKDQLVDEDSILCMERLPRQLKPVIQIGIVQEIDLLPDKSFLNLETVYGNNQFLKVGYDRKFILGLRTHQYIKITGFDILCNLDFDPHHSSFRQRLQSNTASEWCQNTEVKVAVINSSIFYPDFKKDPVSLKPQKRIDSWVHFETSILVPKGSCFQVQVLLKAPYTIRKVSAKDIESPPESGVEVWAQHSYWCSYSAKKYNDPWVQSDSSHNIFKSIQYEWMA